MILSFIMLFMVKISNWIVIKNRNLWLKIVIGLLLKIKINGKILDFVKFKYLKIYEKFFV